MSILAIAAAALLSGSPHTATQAAAAPPIVQAPASPPGEGAVDAARTPRKEASPADVATPEAIISTIYAVISGDASVPRDWDRFVSLFHPTARLVPTGTNSAGQGVLQSMTPEQFSASVRTMTMSEGFHEREIARRIDRFGAIAHAWSTYEGKRQTTDAQPFTRGINSFQLFHDGARWWIVSIFWQVENAQQPIPPIYLPPTS